MKFHALRYSHASALLHEGASINAVSQRLGHSTVELTLRVSFHLLPDADEPGWKQLSDTIANQKHSDEE